MNNADDIVRAAQEAIEHLQGCYEVMSALAEVRKEEIESLQADLARVTAERDAAVRDMKQFTVLLWKEQVRFPCSWCKYKDGSKCKWKIENPQNKECFGKAFEWRGVQTGEGETE